MSRQSIFATILFCILALTNTYAKTNIPRYAHKYDGINYSFAETYCNTSPLESAEGIWRFIDDKTDVLIRKCNNDKFDNYYEIIVLSSADKSLKPGIVIGYLFSTLDANKLKMHLYTKLSSKGIFSPQECVATLSMDKYSLSIECPKIKFRINVTGILPHFWRIIRYKIENPAADLPKGFIKIYPSYDGNGSSLSQPRYL